VDRAALAGLMTALFIALALALVTYGVVLAAAVGSGVWFRSRRSGTS
jgi:hypothetical protein